MQKKVNGTKVSFNDDNNNEILYFDYMGDEFVLVMNTDKAIEIDENSEMYERLTNLFFQKYDFGDYILGDNKTNSQLVCHNGTFFIKLVC